MANLTKPRQMSVEPALGLSRVAQILDVHTRTIERRRASGKNFKPLEMQREEKLRRIWQDLVELFTPKNAIRWLESPLPVLAGQRL